MTGKTRAPESFGPRGTWTAPLPDKMIREIRACLPELPEEAIAKIIEAVEDFRVLIALDAKPVSGKRIKTTYGAGRKENGERLIEQDKHAEAQQGIATKAEQIAACKLIAGQCLDLAKVLRVASIDHAEAAAWLAMQRIGRDLNDDKVKAVELLNWISVAYRQAAESNAIPTITKPAQTYRDEFGLRVLAVVARHDATATKTDQSGIVCAVLAAAGAGTIEDPDRYLRRLKAGEQGSNKKAAESSDKIGATFRRTSAAPCE